MHDSESSSAALKLKTLVVGKPRDPGDRRIFHKLSLIAFFAWVGLGSDGISSSCYGPQEAFLVLQGHFYLAIFVAMAAVVTIIIISTSYSQIIELFPTGGGGYLVASKLLSPTVGMISGSSLIIDYVLTITLSIASGADAIFSFLPLEWHAYRLHFAAAVLILLTLLNLRGIKESVMPLVPVFLIFIITHAFAIVYAIVTHLLNFSQVVDSTVIDVHQSTAQLGLVGMLLLIFKSYSLGAGTFTGIEAVSNGIPILREPKVHTAKRTMLYMALSLSLMVMGLMIAYLLYKVQLHSGKTLNAILFENITRNWNIHVGRVFIFITLLSEATILFVAAQTGFLDGPRVLGNMALDRWMPTKFSLLSDRLVSQNGILIMGTVSLVLMLASKGAVNFLVVLYSINVFITFSLSQLGMVRHWWSNRTKEKHWRRKIAVNGIGLVLTTFILIMVAVLKFDQGGWITIVVTGTLIIVALLVRRHYDKATSLLKRLDNLVDVAMISILQTNRQPANQTKAPTFNPEAKTAVIMVNGFGGLGLHTLFNVIRLFGETFRNFIFVEIGVIDAGNFKGIDEVKRQRRHVKKDVDQYVDFMHSMGYYSEGFFELGIDPVEQIVKLLPKITKRFPNAVFFGGKLVFSQETLATRFLHNNVIFEIQRQFYYQGIPTVILPIRV